MMDDPPLSPYLIAKIADHVGFLLDQYIENPIDIGCAVIEIVEAIQSEIIWARPV